jgi:flagellar biosynthesis protein FliR
VTSGLDSTVLQMSAVGLRVGGLFTFAPFFGSSAIPMRFKAVFVAILSALLYPVVNVRLGSITLASLAQLVLSELMLGLLMGLCLQFAFEAVQLAGQIVGFQLSFSLVNVIDPQTNVDIPVLANLQQLVALLLFLQLNVHHWLLRGLERSFDVVPIGSVAFRPNELHGVFRIAGEMWASGLRLAAPLLVTTLILDVSVGLISKASPQLPVLFLSIPTKSLLGYLVLGLAVGLWPGFFEHQFSNAIGWTWNLLDVVK